MKIAVLNSGSSSLKYKLFSMPEGREIEAKVVEHIGEEGSSILNHHDALDSLNLKYEDIDAFGHRVVHGGEAFSDATLVNERVIEVIGELIPLAPLHNGANLEGILVVQDKTPSTPQVAVFDTSFHATMPEEAYRYALPKEMYTKHQIRRYGFHGTSHSFVSKKAAKILNIPYNKVNLITLHLGNGASVCAIENGKSIDTSMGFTPLEGLVMGSRSGDIDPAIVLFMQRELEMSVNEVDILLNKESGLIGLCAENDVRSLLLSDTEDKILAKKVMVRRIQKYIGAYMALLGHVDGIVFSGGIGENAVAIREMVMDSQLFASLKVLVIKTDEELEIANKVMELVGKGDIYG